MIICTSKRAGKRKNKFFTSYLYTSLILTRPSAQKLWWKNKVNKMSTSTICKEEHQVIFSINILRKFFFFFCEFFISSFNTTWSTWQNNNLPIYFLSLTIKTNMLLVVASCLFVTVTLVGYVNKIYSTKEENNRNVNDFINVSCNILLWFIYLIIFLFIR